MTLENADRLGMIAGQDKVCSEDVCLTFEPVEEFIKQDCHGLVSIMNFVDKLTTYNDLETVKKLLVAIIFDMKNNQPILGK